MYFLIHKGEGEEPDTAHIFYIRSVFRPFFHARLTGKYFKEKSSRGFLIGKTNLEIFGTDVPPLAEGYKKNF